MACVGSRQKREQMLHVNMHKGHLFFLCEFTVKYGKNG